MNVTEDLEFAGMLRAKIVDNYMHRAPRKGHWHVSDLLFPKYAVLSRKIGHKPTDTDVGFFMTGEAYHEFVQKVLGRQFSEHKGNKEDVSASADFFDGEMLIEFKTSRKWTIHEVPDDHYVEQAGYYAAIFGVNKVKIVVLYPTAGRKWDGSSASTLELKAWTVEFSPEDISMITARMKYLRDEMSLALESGDLSNLPDCPTWKYGTVERDAEKKEYFVIKRCPYADVCRCRELEMAEECQRKNDNRRVFPSGHKPKLQTRSKPGTKG